MPPCSVKLTCETTLDIEFSITFRYASVCEHTEAVQGRETIVCECVCETHVLTCCIFAGCLMVVAISDICRLPFPKTVTAFAIDQRRRYSPS